MACVQDLGLLWQPSTPLTVFRLLNVRCRYAFVGGPCEERRCQPKPRSHFTDRPLGLTGMASSITTPDGVRIAYHEVGAGDPPIVFAPGSGNRQARRFFSAACDACRRLGRRGVVLSRYSEHLPAPLPPGVWHAGYAPFSAVLPRAAALVHHGGIGTSAQALAAGRPQLVMPMTFDQPDNAARLTRLGVARTLAPERFTGAAVARELAALLGAAAVARRCAEIARRFDGVDPVGRTCDVIEACGRQAPAPARS